jgi:Uma2 family endonuclease
MATVLFEDQFEIPFVGDLTGFRRWAHSDRFPERGRIDYIAGNIEVDMSPEDLFTHGTLKTEVARGVARRVNELDLGHTCISDTRISSISAELSAEPDIVVVSFQALDEGRVRLMPKATGEEGRFVEVEGAADLIVEIVSDGSATKDKERLPVAYFRAGVREYWLIDARGPQLLFHTHYRGTDGFAKTPHDVDGFRRSEVLDGDFRLDRDRHQRGHWVYELKMR